MTHCMALASCPLPGLHSHFGAWLAHCDTQMASRWRLDLQGLRWAAPWPSPHPRWPNLKWAKGEMALVSLQDP